MNYKDNVYNMDNGGHPAWDVCCTGLMIDTHEYVGYVDRNVCIDRLCLLGRSGVENIMQRNKEYVDVRGLSHRHTVSWDPGVAESRPLAVCNDCLCSISLFRTVMSLSYDWDEVFGWIGHDEGYDCSPAEALGYLSRCLYSPLVMDRMTQYLTEIKVLGWSFVLRETMNTGARRCVCTHGTPPGVFSAGRISLTLIGHRASVGGSVGCADWSRADGTVDISPGGFWIDYIRPGLEDGQSIVAVPVTGSLVSSTLFSCRDVICTAGSTLNWTFCGTDWVLPAGYQVLLQKIAEHWTMYANGFSVVDNRAGIMFGVELHVSWDAPEAVVDVSSVGVVPLRSIPDVIGLVGRRETAVESRVLQGRDTRSVRVLVPDCRGLDQNFHDVTIVDMGELPESHVSLPELSDVMHKWPPAVINHMMWWQRDLEEMRKAAKVKFRQKHPSPCTFCGTLIRCDMYRHVACCHLELAQLWRCPVSWCTVWKGTPQDLMDHIRGAHNVPGEIRKVSLETFFPPWTVTRQVYTDSLTSRHSGISNDVLLFSDIGLSLVHHYRVHKRGLPHVAFRRNNLSQLRALLPLPTVLTLCVPRLDRPDARLVTGGQYGSWSRLYGTLLYSRYRTRWLWRGWWCSIVVPHCCRYRWTLVV